MALMLLLTVSGCGDDPRKLAGDSCQANAECASGACFEQQCLAPNGAACTTAAECASGSCVQDVCAPKTPPDVTDPDCVVDADCASGSCVQGICADTTPPGVTEFFFFGPKLGIEDNALGGSFLPGMSYSETLGITRTGVTVGAECIAGAFFRGGDSGASPLRTTVRCDPADPDAAGSFPYTSGPASMTVTNEAESFINDFGDTEAADGYDTRIIAAGNQSGHPADADVLVGQGLRSYVVTSGDGSTTRGRELNGVVAIRKSKNLPPSAIQGDWGFVTFSSEADATGPKAEYVSGHFAATVGAAVGASGYSILPTGSAYFNIGQGLGGANGQPVTVSRFQGDVDPAVPITVSPSGAVTAGATGRFFSGATSPSGDFMMLYDSDPATWPPFAGEGPIDVPTADKASFVLSWGVKRAADPVATLAGKQYRIVRFAFRAEAGRFVIIYNTDDPTLTFDPTATTATFVATESEFAVSFAGGLFPKKAAVDAPRLSVGLGHAQSFALGSAGEAEPVASGYVSSDGRILVFADGTAQLNAVGAPLNATTGIAFGVCTNCDTLTAN